MSSADRTPAQLPDLVAGYHDDVRRDIVDFVPDGADRLVDLGGGTGATAAHMLSVGKAKSVGVIDQVDSSHADPAVDFHASGNIEDLDFLRESLAAHGPYDTILTLDILEHLVDPWAVVRELHQALVPGGHIVASIPNVRHWRVAAGLLFKGRWTLGDSGILDRTHLRFFVKSTAIELMESSGLRLVTVDTPSRGRHPGLAKIARALGLGGLVAIDYVVVVQRPR